MIDYIIPDTVRIELIFKTCTLEHPLKRTNYEPFLYSNGNMYCQVLKKMIDRPENISIIKAKSSHGCIQAGTYLSQFIMATDNGRLRLNATTIFINLEIACYLLPLGYIPESSSLFTRCLQLLRAENFKHTPSVPRFLKILLIDYLYRMYWQNALSREKIGQALENLIQKVDIGQLFNDSPETVGHLLFLLDIRMFLNREKICEELLSLVKYNQERIPVGVYRQISLFARKSEYQELLALLERKNDETVR